MRQRAGLLLGAVLSIGPFGAFADTVYEIEPNNTPAEATEIRGATTIIGSLQSNDQDGYRWLVSDVDATKRWTLELQGIPGRLTVVDVLRVVYAENGADVTGVDKLFTIGSRDGTRPGLAENLLFEPGEYILGVAHSGDSGTYRPPVDSISFGEKSETEAEESEAGGYRLHIREGEHYSVWPQPIENDTRERAHGVRPGTQFGSFAIGTSSWFKIVFSENDARSYWDFAGQVPVGRHGDAFLRNASGEQLALAHVDQLGKFAFRDLGLPAGDHFVEYQGSAGDAIRFFGSTPIGQVAEGREAEPNGNWNQANRIYGDAIEGRLAAPGDSDFFRLEVDEAHADLVTILALTARGEQRISLCLLDPKGQRVQCRDGAGKLELPDLVLPQGEWGVQVNGGSDTDYTLTYREQGQIKPGVEAEPNDSVAYASSVPAKNRISGRLTGSDTDFFRFVVVDEAQLWRFQASGDGIGGLRFHDGSGIQNQQVAAAARQPWVRLENVFLLPGTHYVSVFGQDGGEYTLLALPRGLPNPDVEFEPNDDVSRAQGLQFGQTRTGLLEPGDRDNYRFHLANWDRIRLTVTPPPDGSSQVNVYWDQGVFLRYSNPPTGEAIVMEGLYQPGDFRVELYPVVPSEAEYTISLERLPRFACPVDCEPNDNPSFANPMPAGQVLEGRVGQWGEWDWYELPAFDSETELRIQPSERGYVEVKLDMFGDNLVAWNEAEKAFLGTVPPAQPSYLIVRPGGPSDYRLDVSINDQPSPAQAADPLSVAMQLDLEATTVSAYRAYGQQFSGSVQLRNGGPGPIKLKLQTASSDRRWQIQTEETNLSIAPGNTTEVPIHVMVPDDAWAGRPVRLSFAAFAPDGRHAEVFQEITVDGDSPAVSPRRHWALPDELLGGFNVALERLGGRWVGEPDNIIGWPEKLIDGIAVDGEGLKLRGGYVGPQAEVVYELAGGEAVEITGVAVNLLFGQPSEFLREVDFYTSLDGVNFERALREKLDPVKSEQAFVLERPVSARFVKLVIGNDFTGRPRNSTTLGELKVIARPGFDLSAGLGFNLASPELGGHVVWSNPPVGQIRERELLSETAENLAVALNPGQTHEWVVGFHHDRAAKISKLEWIYPPGPLRFPKFEKVLISVSMDSPIGPWAPLDEWPFDPESEIQEWLPLEPFWARFVRIAAAGPESGGTVLPPDTLRIWEVPTEGEYRSILTEWGFASQSAIYEFLRDLDSEPPLRVSENTSRELAADLQLDQQVAGTVQLGELANWYQVQVPSDHNTLIMALGGESSVRTVLRAENEAGEAIPTHTRESESTPALQIIETVVEPGSIVYLEVSEPPRNVAFLWDTSPSVGSYVPIIYNAMITYAGNLVPGRDAGNFAPYGRNVLLRDWYGEPYILQTVLNEYPRQESSSAAEYTMELATIKLAKRTGTKAIINVTDAATGQHPPAWEQFAEVKPRIFNLGVSSAGNLGRDPPAEQDLLQDWSRVNGGHYQYMLSQGEMEVAFDRASTMLRRPADYTPRVASVFREAPGPGTLSVVAAEGATGGAGSGGVELILDASGSMLKRLDGKRRIAIAREVLSEAVRNSIPAGTPLALRVFGHKEPSACRTDLEIPLTPLDPDATIKVIEGITAMNLAKTPIAASLAAAEQDLADSEGRSVIFLLTDGEETCDGDPDKAIQALRDKGMDVSINIVGFAIDDTELERHFESWSQAGNGRYFSAQDQSGLSKSITEALQTPYSVFDQAGKRVAEGVVGGEPLKLEQGFYRVVVASSSPQIIDKVEIRGEAEITLEVGTGDL